MNELESIELTIQELFEFLGLANDDYDNAQISKEEIYVKSDKNELIPVLSFVKKNNKPIYKCNIGNDEVIEVADTHIFRSNSEEVFAKDSEGLYLDTLGESVKVNKVEFNGYDDVYDFEVPAPHWYVHNENFANGLISHNTIFLINAGCDTILAGKNVAYFTFEETELEIRERFDARLMNISTSQFPKMGGALMSNFNVLINKGLGDLKIKAYGPRSASVLTVKAQLEEWELKEGFKPDIVILDSITIIAPSTKTDNMYMNGKNVSEEAKALGIQLGVPVISAVQFGRCLDLNTNIELENGTRIKIKDVNIGDRILSHDGYRLVKHVFPIEKKKRYLIKTKSGKEIVCSDNHLFPTNKGEISINTGLSINDKIIVKTCEI